MLDRRSVGASQRAPGKGCRADCRWGEVLANGLPVWQAGGRGHHVGLPSVPPNGATGAPHDKPPAESGGMCTLSWSPCNGASLSCWALRLAAAWTLRQSVSSDASKVCPSEKGFAAG